jgi:hypothetical protein
VWDASVRDDVVIDPSALDLAHRLDLFTVLFRFVVLFAVLMQAMMSFDVTLLGPRCFFNVAGPAFLQLLDETTMCLLAVLPLGVSLRSRVVRLSVSHRRVLPCVIVLTEWAQARGQQLPPATSPA